MTDAWSSFLQTVLWLCIIVYFIFKLRNVIRVLPDVIKTRLEAGASFGVGLFSVGTPPEAIAKGEKGAVTSEGTGGISTSKELEFMMINRMYPTGFSDEYYLVHGWEEIQQSSDENQNQFRIRLWLETLPGLSLDQVSRVTYRLPQEFPRQVVTTEARSHDFELWLNTSKEFNITAYIEEIDKTSIWLNRHVTLPGRPQAIPPGQPEIRSLPIRFEPRIDILDKSQTVPTVVYGEDWISIKWEIPGINENINGYWNVDLFFESITDGDDQNLNETLPARISNRPSIFTKDITIDYEQLPSDLYRMACLINFVDNNNKKVGLIGATLKTKPVYIYKKLPPSLRHSVLVSVDLDLRNEAHEKTDLLPCDRPWSVHVNWDVDKLGSDILGYWQVQAYFHPYGPGRVIKLAQQPIPVVMTHGRQTEVHDLDIPVDPQSIEPGAYDVVVVVFNVDQNFVPTDVVGFSEVPSRIQIFETS